MKIFRSKYNKLRDKILTEIKVLEIKRELLKVDQSKIKVTLKPEEWIRLNYEILKVGYQIDELNKIVK